MDVPKFTVRLASSADEIRELMAFRYRIFMEDMRLSALFNADRIDCDDFDHHCDHLVVRDMRTAELVGTCRLLPPQAVRKAGRFYSEQEFDLGRLKELGDRVVEVGRVGIHRGYREGSVARLMWAATMNYVRKARCEYLIGCMSIHVMHGKHHAAAVCRALLAANSSPAEYRVIPRLPFPMRPAAESQAARPPRIPPLIKSFLRSGAWVCGEPAWDPEFECADLLMMLALQNMERRYARRFLKRGEPENGGADH